MANETCAEGKVTFHGDVEAVATFVSMNNSFFGFTSKSKRQRGTILHESLYRR